MSMTDYVIDVTLTAQNELQFTFNTPNRVVLMAPESGIVVKDKLGFIQIHNNIFQVADVQADLIQTVNGVAFAGTHADLLASVQAMSETANGGVVTPTGAGVDTWLYENTTHTFESPNVLNLAGTYDFTLSDTVSLVHKDNVNNNHDGTNFKFTEGDIIKVDVYCTVDPVVAGNIITLSVKEESGFNNLVLATEDLNRNSSFQHLQFDFPAFTVDATTAAGGFAVYINSYISTDNTAMYDIKISITKLGTSV